MEDIELSSLSSLLLFAAQGDDDEIVRTAVSNDGWQLLSLATKDFSKLVLCQNEFGWAMIGYGRCCNRQQDVLLASGIRFASAIIDQDLSCRMQFVNSQECLSTLTSRSGIGNLGRE